jgi:hypothetical protein
MRYIEPTSIDDTSLLSTTATDPTDAYSAAATYASGDRVAAGNVIYESLVDNNTGNNPPDSLSAWMSVGATNPWAMFDAYVMTQTEATTSISISVDSSRCDALAFFGLEATEISIAMYDTSGEDDVLIYDEDVDLLMSTSVSWMDYFFGPIFHREDIYRRLPVGASSRLDVTISAASGDTVRVGQCIVGRSRYIGSTVFGAGIGILDYSRKDTNENGYTYLAQGNSAKRATLTLELSTRAVDPVNRMLTGLRGTPIVYVGDDRDEQRFESMLVYGFYREFDIELQNAVTSECSIEIEGLI